MPKWHKETNLCRNLRRGLQSSTWFCKVQHDSRACSPGPLLHAKDTNPPKQSAQSLKRTGLWRRRATENTRESGSGWSPENGRPIAVRTAAPVISAADPPALQLQTGRVKRCFTPSSEEKESFSFLLPLPSLASLLHSSPDGPL